MEIATVVTVIISVVVGIAIGRVTSDGNDYDLPPNYNFGDSYQWHKYKTKVDIIESKMYTVEFSNRMHNCLCETPETTISKIPDEKLLAECNRRKLKTVIQK